MSLGDQALTYLLRLAATPQTKLGEGGGGCLGRGSSVNQVEGGLDREEGVRLVHPCVMYL